MTGLLLGGAGARALVVGPVGDLAEGEELLAADLAVLGAGAALGRALEKGKEKGEVDGGLGLTYFVGG